MRVAAFLMILLRQLRGACRRVPRTPSAVFFMVFSVAVGQWLWVAVGRPQAVTLVACSQKKGGRWAAASGYPGRMLTKKGWPLPPPSLRVMFEFIEVYD